MKRFFTSRLFAVVAIVAVFVATLFTVGAQFGAGAAILGYLVADSLARLPLLSLKLGLITSISDLWTPQIWVPGMAERVVTRPSLLNSPVVVRSPELDAIASGGGITGNMPFLKEPDGDEAIQVEDTAPTAAKIGSGNQICPILNREVAVAATALSSAVSAADPVGFALDIMADWRLRRRQKTLVSALRGFLATAAAAVKNDKFVEVVGNQDANLHFIKSSYVNATLALLGERKELMTRGAMLCHTVIETALNNQDGIDYIRDSQGVIVLRVYKGMPLFVSDTLSRAGTTSGTVYETYFMLPGSVGMGDKPQVSKIGEVASLVLDGDAAKNNLTIYDRTRHILHPSGAKWVGTPSGQSATDAELATAGNWNLAYGDVKNVGIALLRTNG